MSNKDNGKKGNTGCFIITFLVIAAGIPSALAHAKEGPYWLCGNLDFWDSCIMVCSQSS